MNQFSDDRGAELRELFFESAQEILQSLNDEALKLEKQPGDSETVRSLRRAVHTLKGDSAAVGFQELSDLAHEFEDALALESAATHGSLTEIAFSAADIFGGMLGAYRNQTELPDSSALRKRIAELTKDPKAKKTRARKAKAAGVSAVTWTEYEKLAMQKAAQEGKTVFHVQVQIDPHCAMPIAARQLVLKALVETSEVIGSRPEAGSADASPLFQILVASSASAEKLATKCKIPTVISQVKVERVEMAVSAPAAEAPAESLESKAPPSQISTPAAATVEEPAGLAKAAPTTVENILRVDAERIDTVLNLVGELIIGKSMLQQAINEFVRRYPKDPLRGRFSDAMAFQSRVLGDLQRSVMKVRMVPVEQLFRRFPRMVRDAAKHCGKDVQLVLSGEDTDLDKSLLDAIAEPMTHLVRNAVSHGIESAEERVKSGKPAQGTVRLDAYHHGNQVIVEVRDDGGGIDAAKIKKRAVERGLVRPEDASRLTDSEIFSFIFQPGFSTAEQITEISGRGVGLDVVQTVMQRLKGTVQAESQPGKGTTFRLRLPLTLAIIKALLFRVDQRLYAIPLNSVGEIARADESEIHEIDGREVMQLRNQVLPLIRLGNKPAEAIEERRGKIFILVIHIGERGFGLLVNGLEGEEELVIKALDDQTVETDLVSGASILGDGRVVLILNLVAMVERFSKMRFSRDAGVAVGGLLSRAESARSSQAAKEVRQ